MGDSLAEALPKEIIRVRKIQDHYKALLDTPGVMVEPQIAMMEVAIQRAVTASAEGDLVGMIYSFKDLNGYTE